MKRSRRLLIGVITAVTPLAACAARATPPRIIPLSTVRAAEQTASRAVDDYTVMLAPVLAIMEQDLKFPPLDGSVYMFADRRSLQAWLVSEGYELLLAHQVSVVMDAVSSPLKIRVTESALRVLTPSDRMRMLAHELTHAAEYQLSGGRRGTSDQWLREGFADWVSFRVLASLRVTSLGLERTRAVTRIQRAHGPSGLPRLGAMVAFRDWLRLAARQPVVPLYEMAFLATDRLIERHGLDAVIAYFRLFSRSDDRIGNFRAAFGEDLIAFADESDKEFRTSVR